MIDGSSRISVTHVDVSGFETLFSLIHIYAKTSGYSTDVLLSPVGNDTTFSPVIYGCHRNVQLTRSFTHASSADFVDDGLIIHLSQPLTSLLYGIRTECQEYFLDF